MGIFNEFLRKLLRIFFYLIYNPLAWTYDAVADLVSIGRWKDWIFLALPYLQNSPILELGHGPGHLQVALHKEDRRIYGIDASQQMVRIAKKRITEAGYIPLLVHGKAGRLPYSSNIFRNVVATFPSEYIVEIEALTEIWRVLTDGGELLVVAGAWITGDRLQDRIAAWLFRVTGQVPQQSVSEIQDWLSQKLENNKEINFQIETKLIELQTSQVLLIRARKAPP